MRIVIEADAIVAEKMSGIGHATLEIIRALSRQLNASGDQLVIIVPFGSRRLVERYELPNNVRVRQLPPFYKYVNYALTRTSLPIPMDVLYGKGVYIFPNYKTWYVPFSRSLTFVHDIAFKIMPDVTHPKNLNYLEANFSRWLKRSDIILAISNKTVQDIQQYLPEYLPKVQKVYLGVDNEVYYPRSLQEVAAAAKKYGLKPNYFVYVGNIEPRKNLSTLLDAYALYCDQYGHNTQLVLIGGDGWRNEGIIKQVEDLRGKGYDIYRPSLYVEDDDLPAIYSGCKALVHIALHEGYGLSLVQAQACGSPIVASDLAVFRETLNPEGVLYVDAMNGQQIAQAMSRVINTRIPVNATPRHTWDETAANIIEQVSREAKDI